MGVHGAAAEAKRTHACLEVSEDDMVSESVLPARMPSRCSCQPQAKHSVAESPKNRRQEERAGTGPLYEGPGYSPTCRPGVHVGKRNMSMSL